MTQPDVAQLAYLLILIAAVGSYVVVTYRDRMGQALQHFLVWVMIGVGVMAAIGLWQDMRPNLFREAVFSDAGQISVPRGPDGHYHLTLKINGTPLRFIVDTGASDIVLSQDDARNVGIDLDSLQYFGAANTANGQVQTARVVLDRVELGPYTDAEVPARVNGGEMTGSLLGMRYLARFDKLEISGDRLTLTR